tara:strand:+ start:148 stop:975 length:828 start_codon:yes stop_codon:yes gene_type:complete
MKIKSGFFGGLFGAFNALPFMKTNGLMIWLVPAIALSLAMSYGLFAVIDLSVELAGAHYKGYFGNSSFDVCNGGILNSWECALEVIKSAGEYAVSAVVWLGLFWLKIKLMKYLVLSFLGPVMAMLSELTEQKVTGVIRPFKWTKFLLEVFRGIRTAVLYLFIELSLGLLLLLIALVTGIMFPIFLPIIAPLELVLAFLMGAFFYGAAAMDYVWEREGVGALDSFRKAVKNKRLVVGLGFVFAIVMAVPIVNFTLAPVFAPAITAVGAVLVLKHKS